MSFNGILDKDRENKISLFNLFFNIGFTPRLEIPLCEYFKGEKIGGELTDLDVYGLKYIPFIGLLKITASAKGEAKNVSHTSEIFKLKGVNEYFQPIKSFYIHDTSPTDELYFFSKKIGIEILSKSSLSTIMTRLDKYFMISNKGAESISKSLQLTKELGYYDFITSEFWLSKKADKLYKLEGLLEKIFKKIAKIEQDNYFLLVLYLISLYIISVLEILETIHNSPGSDFKYRLKLSMHGGKDLYKNTIELIDGFKEYLKGLKAGKNNFNYDIYIPNFEKYLELFKRTFINIEGLDLALITIDFIIFFLAEAGVTKDINNVVKLFTASEEKLEQALSFLRYLFKYLTYNIDPKIEIIAKKINLLR